MSEQAAAEPPPSLQDLLLPAVPSAMTSLLLEGLSELSGLQKIGAGALLGVGLWWVLRRRRAAASGTTTPSGGVTAAPEPSGPQPGWGHREWTLALLAVVAVALVSLLVAVVAFGRPTSTTALVTAAVVAVLVVTALRERVLPGAAAAAVSGGLVGLCVGIAVL